MTDTETQTALCGSTTLGLFDNPLGPCVREQDHPQMFHRDARGTEWRRRGEPFVTDLPVNPGRIYAPWTTDQVVALTGFQYSGSLHPFTCPNEEHQQNVLLSAERHGWKCRVQGCTYTQDWAHAFMANPDTWNIHRFTARPVSAEEERIATERSVKMAEESAKSAKWFKAHSSPDPEVTALQTLIDAALTHHQPVAGGGGPYCGTCTQEDEQPAPTGWWVPFPCPTVQALTGPAEESEKSAEWFRAHSGGPSVADLLNYTGVPAELLDQREAPYPAHSDFTVEAREGDMWVPVRFKISTIDNARLFRDNNRHRFPDGTRMRIVEWTETSSVAEEDEETA